MTSGRGEQRGSGVRGRGERQCGERQWREIAQCVFGGATGGRGRRRIWKCRGCGRCHDNRGKVREPNGPWPATISAQGSYTGVADALRQSATQDVNDWACEDCGARGDTKKFGLRHALQGYANGDILQVWHFACTHRYIIPTFDGGGIYN